MLSTKDLDYIDTKLVKQGKKALNIAFVEIIEWVELEFQVKLLNIYYDINKPFNNPRINIVLETHEDEQKFRAKDKINFDKKKQDTIARKFIDLIKTHGLTDEYRTDKLFVYFSSFSPIAVSEAGMRICQDLLMKFKENYINDFIWEIHHSGSRLVVFFDKHKEIEMYRNTKIIEEIKKEYFNLIKPYDEFNFIKEISVSFDSKENFKKKYDGSWMNYYR
jgi:hypothetical protein